jgi:hypothetical protein
LLRHEGSLAISFFKSHNPLQTNTSFSFIQYATVAECKPEDLKQGHVEIKFIKHAAISSMLRQKNDIILVESQAFFPAYFHTLESIKNIKIDQEHDLYS